jgi:glutamate-ammonia-ligase adenylyltransferase
MHRAFKDICFRDREQAAQFLAEILDGARPGLAEALADALSETSDPSAVLVGMKRFLEAGVSPRVELDHMGAAPRYAHLLCTIFDQSHYLTDIVCRNPEYALWLWLEAPLDRARTREETSEELSRQVAVFNSFDARRQSMRRFKRREVLRIAARDVVEHVSLESLVEDLSNLADAVLEAALRCAQDALLPRFGTPRHRDAEGNEHDTGFVILAMGKLGGRELNFSSDIDLVFFYTEDGETTGGASGEISNAEYFQKLGELVIKALSEQTAEGSIFRVDMRLRPHGRFGPLAVSIESAIKYYEQSGQAWERQALIKARPVAGDLALGEYFIERTRPFVFPRYFDDDTLENILDVKRRMESEVASRGETKRNVKLGRGGIRDIEFVVQMLQLLNGGKFPELRAPNTLDAIRALGQWGRLTPFEAGALASSYVFLRQIEHRLQIEGSRQRHELPSAPEALDLLARRLGYASGPSFMAEYRDHTEETRRILDRFTALGGSGNLWVTDLLDPRSDGAAGISHLSALGFADPAKAREELLLLCVGPPERAFSLHVRQQFSAIAPALIAALAATANPDSTLLRLGRMLANLRAPNAIYDILKWDPDLSKKLVTLVANSEYLTELIIRDPGLFDLFGSARGTSASVSRERLETALADLTRAYDADAAPHRFVQGEMVRIGMRELFDQVSVLEVGYELTQVAEVCLAHMLAEARAKAAERYGAARAAFAVLGLGKLGGRELGYGSDLDLIFVYESGGTAESGTALSEYFAAVASNTIRALKEPARYGLLYDIDARLRPDGNKGVLAISDRRIEEYYLIEAQPWERLALVKVRAVAGDVAFGEAVAQRARDPAFSLELTPETLEQIDAIRRKIVGAASPLDLKKGEGGLVELEFAVRLLQLRHAAEIPDLKRGDVLGAIDVLAQRGVLSPEEFGVVTGAYLLFRKIENRIRMMHGRSGSALPEDPGERADLAKRLNIAGDLLDVVSEHKARVHAFYEKTLHAF